MAHYFQRNRNPDDDLDIKAGAKKQAMLNFQFHVRHKETNAFHLLHRLVWRVNFYKCADDTSHPHWLTWSPVDLPEPNFHHPQSFGILQFE